MNTEAEITTVGHQVSPGYPYDGVESQRFFNQRPVLEMKDGKIGISVNPNIFAMPTEGVGTPFADFCLFRLIEFQEALTMAEEQIQDILTEDPFIPENYGFEVVHENEKPSDAPIRVYVSKFDDNVSIFRQPGNVNDPKWNPASWTLLTKKTEDGETNFKSIDLLLPSARIAYAVLYALGIQVDEPEEEQAPNKNVTHKVKFERGEEKRWLFVNAEDDKDAISKAKFLFETDTDYPIENIEFSELSLEELSFKSS